MGEYRVSASLVARTFAHSWQSHTSSLILFWILSRTPTFIPVR